MIQTSLKVEKSELSLALAETDSSKINRLLDELDDVCSELIYETEQNHILRKENQTLKSMFIEIENATKDLAETISEIRS